VSAVAARRPAWRADPSWPARAACLGTDPDLWFPPPGDAAPQYLEQARKICAACPVRDTCLEYSLDLRIDTGVWGGMSVSERRRERRGRGAARRRERDAAIAAAAADGHALAVIAAQFNVSTVTARRAIEAAQRGAA
jgi:WhiB family transcriptional regulator, redox-sensing transcriptional regulator